MIKPKTTGKEKMYIATLERIKKIKDNKKSLEGALKKVDNMPLSKEQQGKIKTTIKGYIKKI